MYSFHQEGVCQVKCVSFFDYFLWPGSPDHFFGFLINCHNILMRDKTNIGLFKTSMLLKSIFLKGKIDIGNIPVAFL